jgi:hypothetical protein
MIFSPPRPVHQPNEADDRLWVCHPRWRLARVWRTPSEPCSSTRRSSTRCPRGLTRVTVARTPRKRVVNRGLSVTETDPVNERPSVQEDSQPKECDANHDPEHGCVREDQDRDTDQRCDYPERSHGAFSHRLTPLRVSVLLLGWSTTAGRRDEQRVGPKRLCRCPRWIPRGTQPSHDPQSARSRSSRVADTLGPSWAGSPTSTTRRRHGAHAGRGARQRAVLPVEGPLGTTPVHPVSS